MSENQRLSDMFRGYRNGTDLKWVNPSSKLNLEKVIKFDLRLTENLENSSILPHTKLMPKILINVNATLNSKNASKKMSHRNIYNLN